MVHDLLREHLVPERLTITEAYGCSPSSSPSNRSVGSFGGWRFGCQTAPEVWLPNGAGAKIGVATEGLAQAQQGAGGRGSPIRGLQPFAVDASSPSSPLIPPILVEGVVGSSFLNIPGLVWDTLLGISQKGLFPVGGRLLFFLPAWQWITLDQFVL